MDDDVDDLAFIQEAIKNHSTPFTVVEAKNGEEGIAYLSHAKAMTLLKDQRVAALNVLMPQPQPSTDKVMTMVNFDLTCSRDAV